jgi:hypothetical protein
VWYAAAIIGTLSAAMFLRLHRREAKQLSSAAAPGA